MSTRSYDIHEEPSGAAYRALVGFLGNECATAGLVMRLEGLTFQDSAHALLRVLAPFAISDEHVASWPGTELSAGKEARLVRFRMTPESNSVIAKRTDRLYEWSSPSLPEDLCVWRPDGSLLLGTIAHERDGWLELTAAEFGVVSAYVKLLGECE